MRYVVTGAKGQLGAELIQQLDEAGHDVVAFGRGALDIRNAEAVKKSIDRLRPSVVLNAAAYNAVDQAEQEQDEAMAVNALGPANLAAACREVDAKFIHFSTDYVFGDGHMHPIDESRRPEPLSVYARSKRLGEELALHNCTRTFVLRTTGLYSHRRNNFVKTMVNLALQGKPLTVVNDQFVSPTWVRPLAAVAIELSRTDVFGVYHAVSHGGCSWYELATRTFELLGIDAELHATNAEAWGAAARRPQYSVLDNRMLRLLGLDRFESWDQSLADFLEEYREELT